LSCPCWQCELNWRQVKTAFSILNIFETKQFCRVPHFETRQNCIKLNMFRFEMTCLRFSSHHRHRQDMARQPCLVGVGDVKYKETKFSCLSLKNKQISVKFSSKRNCKKLTVCRTDDDV